MVFVIVLFEITRLYSDFEQVDYQKLLKIGKIRINFVLL